MSSDVEHGYGWSSTQASDGNRLGAIERYRLTVSREAADIWFKIVVQRVTEATEIRGRIVGPRSLFTEVGRAVSPLRSVRQQGELIARTAIPNPAFWSPEDPLLYRVVVELWQDGLLCEVSGFDLGFRKLELGPNGVFVNSRPFLLKGKPCLPQTREETVTRRQGGYNLLLARKGEWHWWVRANPMGFLLLEEATVTTLKPQYISLLYQQPCFFGFLLGKELLNHPVTETESFLRPWQERGVYMGLELDEGNVPPLPCGLSFLVCPESVLPSLDGVSLPKIILHKSEMKSEEWVGAAGQGVVGWIDLR
jgi:hypothetical protein